MRLLGLVALAGVAGAATDCSNVKVCVGTLLNPGCGWCWDATTTVGQVHGGRAGNASGPTDGLGPCGDWAASALDCHTHVDCPALPDCSNILGTYCGWCSSTGRGTVGTASGPTDPRACNSSDWIWEHTSCPAIRGPQQVRVSISNRTDSAELVFSWADTVNASGGAELTLGDAATWPSGAVTHPASYTAFGPAQGNSAGVPSYYFARASGLKSGGRYKYTVATAGVVSDVFEVRAPEISPGEHPTLIVYGDMGRHGGGFILRQLQREVDASMRPGGANNLTAMLHIGDYAYDLQDDGGVNGDTFMNRIQGMRRADGSRGQLFTAVPGAFVVGNHEIEGGTFSNFRHRFRMPGSEANDGYDMWWSADLGSLHLVGVDTESFFARPQDNARQLAWLKADLAAANARRGSVPWIVVAGHRPTYCSNLDGDDCTKPDSVIRAAFEDILVDAKVDLALWAHEHSYERMWPVAANGTLIDKTYVNPKYPVNIVTGFAGCNEASGACLNPIGPPLGPWSAYRQSIEGTYTYSRLRVANNTHLHWQAVVPEANNRVEDDLWIVQEGHP